MATYIELHDVRNNQDLVRKVHVAICDVALDILVPENPTSQARKDWAIAAMKNPDAYTLQFIHYILMKNKAVTQAQIIAASDAAVKTNIAEAVTKLIGAPA